MQKPLLPFLSCYHCTKNNDKLMDLFGIQVEFDADTSDNQLHILSC